MTSGDEQTEVSKTGHDMPFAMKIGLSLGVCYSYARERLTTETNGFANRRITNSQGWTP